MIKFLPYTPLFILIGIGFLGAIFLWLGGSGQFMPFFMGLVFLFFAFVKLINLNDFSDGFRKYDILAQLLPWYGKTYPFIELLLGLLYLAHCFLLFTNIATLILMTINAIGVVKSMMSGQKIQCACLGKFIDVPLSNVSLIENIAMGFMALSMLV